MRIFFVAVVMILTMTPAASANNIKQPNVSGQFYSADPSALSAQIDTFLQQASVKSPARNAKDIQILIAPHAGYVYSGGVAAHGFKAVSHKKFKTIVILAPSHYFGFDGVSVWNEGGFKTPLGVIEVDQEFSKKLIDLNEKVYFDPKVFEQEHSLEVELPFLQKVFEGFKIVPVIMGQADVKLCKELALGLNKLIGERDDVLVVVSSDMSHYHDGQTARKMDHTTIQLIRDLQVERLWNQCRIRRLEMCGFVPVTTALFLAQERNLSVDVLKYANSGDVSGDKDRVVGYTSIIFYSEGKKTSSPSGQDSLNLTQKKRLIDIARQTIEEYVRTKKTREVSEPDARLSAPEGAFVTIHKKGKLRGCIGNIVTSAPLFRTVRDMAVAAASSDPRFKPVTEEELDDLEVEVSVLSKPRRITNVEEIEAGVHGVIISRGPRHQGVFLPQVATEWGWNREQLLSNLCSHKAGLPPDAWKDPGTHIQIFTADVFSEKDVK